MLKQVRTSLAFLVSMLIGMVGCGSLVYGQYNWTPIDATVSKWLLSGIHTYNNNQGGVVIGDNLPGGNLLLEVNGQMGMSELCDSAGNDCFDPELYRWRGNGNDMYTIGYSVGVGTTSPSELLHVNGSIDAGGYLYSSDRRLKEHIIPVEGAETIGQLQGVSFIRNHSGRTQIGFLAQEVARVVPQLVRGETTQGYQSVNYMGLIAPLIESLKTQQKDIRSLRREIVTELDTLSQQ